MLQGIDVRHHVNIAFRRLNKEPTHSGMLQVDLILLYISQLYLIVMIYNKGCWHMRSTWRTRSTWSMR